MECSEPGLVRDEELLAYLAGERVRPLVEQHVTCCAHCSLRLATMRRLELSLLSKLYRWDCPPHQVLGEYQLGMLDPETTQAVRLHLRACVACSSELSTLGEFLAGDPMLVVAQPATGQSFAPHAAQNNHQSNHHASGATLKQVLDSVGTDTRRIIAALLPPQPRLAYQRNTAPTSLWPRHYAADDFTISLQIERENNRADLLQLIGFVTRKDSPLEALQGMPVLISSQAGAPATQHVDELGNFIFPALIPAIYTLELQTPTGIIVIEQIPLDVQEK